MDMGCCYSEFHALCDRQTYIYQPPVVVLVYSCVCFLFVCWCVFVLFV